MLMGGVDEGGDEGGNDKGPAWRSRAEYIIIMRRTSEGWGCMLIEVWSRGRGVRDKMDVIWVLEGRTTRECNFLNTYLSKFSSLGA